RGRAGAAQVLSYCGRGEMVGEMGLFLGRPRSATCVAYAHPPLEQPHRAQGLDYGKWRGEAQAQRVELVRFPRRVYDALIQRSPAFREKVRQEVERRQGRDVERERRAAWEDGPRPVLTPQAAQLGLVQGQKLMLIDLERCTRCDECVHACAHSHADGRSRLFLDGPRFGRYLVPTTCRSCIDPVCMIG